MRPLHRKLLRDLSALRGQVLTVALVIAAGIASFVSLRSTYSSLEFSRDAYYERSRFADVFATLERAPEALGERVAQLPGVAFAHTRVVVNARLPLEDSAGEQPPIGVVVSIPADADPPLNALHLVRGRMPDPHRSDEVLLLEKFAARRKIAPGDRLRVVIDGRLKELHIAGTALSPEFIYPVAAGSELAPDEERFAVLWMERGALARLVGMEGAFNDVVLRLGPGVEPERVLTGLDRLLERYGGIGALARKDQASHFILTNEIEGLRSLANVVPMLFLAVAAFLVNVVLSRLVLLQRSQIAVLKAVGYTGREIGAHFLQLALVFALLGAALGIALGAVLGSLLTGLYADVFGLPSFQYLLTPREGGTALAVGLAAAGLGAAFAVLRVMRLPPAEAMRPPQPPTYRPTLLERAGFHRVLGPSARMVLRELERTPGRTLLSVTGISVAVAMLVVGRYYLDAVEALIDFELHRVTREDITVAFNRPVEAQALSELAALPGVLSVEGRRIVPVRFHAGHREREGLLHGAPPDARLRRITGMRTGHLAPRDEGLLLTEKLAEILEVAPGDDVEVEVLEGERRTVRLRVAALVDELTGLNGHLPEEALHAALGEQRSYSVAMLLVDPRRRAALDRALSDRPAVASVTDRRATEARFREQLSETIVVMTLIATAFAATIAVGVVYNNARVALSVRARDLASLRVLGLTRREISAILLGELAVQLLAALGPGLLLGRYFSALIAATAPEERIRFPLVITGHTYAFAVGVTLLAGLASALLVRRRLDRLDLVAVLKAPE